MEPAKEKSKKMKKTGRRKKKQMMKPCYINPWDFEDVVTPLDEDLSLTKLELGELECRSNYGIRLLSNTDANINDLLYKIYGEEVSKSPSFMRNWIRLYTMTNKKQLEHVARKFLDITYKSHLLDKRHTKWHKRKSTYVIYTQSSHRNPLLHSPKTKKVLDNIERKASHSCRTNAEM